MNLALLNDRLNLDTFRFTPYQLRIPHADFSVQMEKIAYLDGGNSTQVGIRIENAKCRYMRLLGDQVPPMLCVELDDETHERLARLHNISLEC